MIEIPKKGGSINDKKCELFILKYNEEERVETIRRFRELLPQIGICEQAEMTTLGAPLTNEAIPPTLKSKKEEVERLMSRLDIIDSHPAFTILRNCFSLPKFLYILRTSPTFKSTDSLREIDDIIFKGLSSVTNVSFEGPAGTQASLPVSRGGLGIRRACDVAIPAFLSSSYATATLVGEILNKPYQMPSSGVAEALTIWKAGVFGANEPLEPLKAMQKS